MPEDTNETLAVQGLSTSQADELVASLITGAVPVADGWKRSILSWRRDYRVPCLDAKDAGGRVRPARLVLTVGRCGVGAELRCLMGCFYADWIAPPLDGESQVTGEDLAECARFALGVMKHTAGVRCAQRAAEAWALAEAMGAPELMVKPYRPGGA